MRDEVFSGVSNPKPFSFDEHIVDFFDDMLGRSIPYYSEVQRMAVELTQHILNGNGGTVYDIGCSTGNTLLRLKGSIPSEQNVNLVGIDPSRAMCEKFAKKLSDAGSPGRIRILECGAEDIDSFPDARVVLMLFTLQFLDLPHRDCVLQKVYNSLADEGGVVIGEKIHADDPEMDAIYTGFYQAYKMRNGYSQEEIENKKKALENVLAPRRNSENRRSLESVGFRRVDEVFRWYNFSVFLALK
ncbi:tRNA (cmo5U34)-methyltransferase [Haloactinospora alba]|uniref:Carboxy-S-adenosyl-L-methionine synthase n=1 Tax=Haloactinospora alba TaxID=405555 RepID=A0A543NHC7_9ACTN|nr:carboxy-S-adenosyl-L-methionine synthase CmoA [Haloactinospora alba]TQN31256.1 tRNA (cmo5U34)-methyltransferase [Haloactinospora alba]